MKIDNLTKSLGGVAPSDARGRSTAGTAKPDSAAAAGEKVELSSLSASLKQAEATIASTPVVNSARVQEIRQAIAEGRFKIDPERIADGLIESVREMLAAQPPRT